jgi:hypothetical protein
MLGTESSLVMFVPELYMYSISPMQNTHSSEAATHCACRWRSLQTLTAIFMLAMVDCRPCSSMTRAASSFAL